VIAIAGKSIDGLSWLKAQRMKRLVSLVFFARVRTWIYDDGYSEQAETGLKFLGLIIFENKLKPGTAPAIQALRSAHLACRMITGDNPLTAVSVAQECNLISQAAHVFMPTFIQGGCTIHNPILLLTFQRSRKRLDTARKALVVLHGRPSVEIRRL